VRSRPKGTARRALPEYAAVSESSAGDHPRGVQPFGRAVRSTDSTTSWREVALP